MSTPTSKLTSPRPTVAPPPVAGQTDTPAPLASGAATAQVLTGAMYELRGMGTPSKRWGNGSFGVRKAMPDATQGADSAGQALTAPPSIPTGYSLPPGVGGPSGPSEAQMPRAQTPPQTTISPNRPMHHPIPGDGQSSLQHLWHSLAKIGENIASLVQAIARAMGNLHH